MINYMYLIFNVEQEIYIWLRSNIILQVHSSVGMQNRHFGYNMYIVLPM